MVILFGNLEEFNRCHWAPNFYFFSLISQWQNLGPFKQHRKKSEKDPWHYGWYWWCCMYTVCLNFSTSILCRSIASGEFFTHIRVEILLVPVIVRLYRVFAVSHLLSSCRPIGGIVRFWSYCKTWVLKTLLDTCIGVGAEGLGGGFYIFCKYRHRHLKWQQKLVSI